MIQKKKPFIILTTSILDPRFLPNPLIIKQFKKFSWLLFMTNYPQASMILVGAFFSTFPFHYTVSLFSIPPSTLNPHGSFDMTSLILPCLFLNISLLSIVLSIYFDLNIYKSKFNPSFRIEIKFQTIRIIVSRNHPAKMNFCFFCVHIPAKLYLLKSVPYWYYLLKCLSLQRQETQTLLILFLFSHFTYPVPYTEEALDKSYIYIFK